MSLLTKKPDHSYGGLLGSPMNFVKQYTGYRSPAEKADAWAKLHDRQKISDDAYPNMTDEEKWNRNIQLMLQSHDPDIQKQGESMIGAYHQRMATPPPQPNFAAGRLSPAEASRIRYKPEYGGGPVDVYTPLDSLVGKVEVHDPASDPSRSAAYIVDEFESQLFGENGLMRDAEDETFMDRVQRTIKNNVELYAQTDPRIASYHHLSQAALSSIARNLGEEKGALAEGDVARAQGFIPQLTGLNIDSPEVAKHKLKVLRALLNVTKHYKYDGSSKAEFDKVIVEGMKGLSKLQAKPSPTGQLPPGYKLAPEGTTITLPPGWKKVEE